MKNSPKKTIKNPKKAIKNTRNSLQKMSLYNIINLVMRISARENPKERFKWKKVLAKVTKLQE